MSHLYDYIVKIVFIGDTNVGKSSILSRYTENECYKAVPTIGVEFKAKYMTYKQNVYKLYIWDTAGQERYKSIVNIYYRNAQVVLFVFDLTCSQSFYNIPEWINNINSQINNSYISIIIGNKCDSEYRKITSAEAAKFAGDNNSVYIETSAVKNINITELFHTMIYLVELNKDILFKPDINLIKIMPDSNQEKKLKKCC